MGWWDLDVARHRQLLMTWLSAFEEISTNQHKRTHTHMVDMVQMVGWPKDVSLDVDLDVVKIKSALNKYFLAKAEPTSSFWDVGAKRVDGTSQHPASCIGLQL